MYPFLHIWNTSSACDNPAKPIHVLQSIRTNARQQNLFTIVGRNELTKFKRKEGLKPYCCLRDFLEPFCFQVTLLHRHPHDTRHRLHTKLLHSLQENHKKSIAFLWPNLPNLYLEIPRNIHKTRLFDYLKANLELVIFASLAALLLSSVLLYPAVQECATVQLQ